jgi:hypothetical protein
MAILASHHPETPAIAPPNNKLARSAAYILNDIGTSQYPARAVWIHCMRDGSRLATVGVHTNHKAEVLGWITNRRLRGPDSQTL